MNILEELRDLLDSGDPTIRTWFLVDSYFLPPFLSLCYVLFVKSIGPVFMKDRKPFELRNIMICYNIFLVSTYAVSLLVMLITTLLYNLFSLACVKTSLVKEGTPAYIVASFAFVLYALKYIEYLDTIFFVLRKKNHLITNLHVVHHASLPVISWWFLRTEFSGYQVFPAMLNGFVHVIMYTYYGLAALGPKMKPYLWWKKYLTLFQMVQFIVIFLFTSVFIPLSGCHASKYGIVADLFFAVLFFAMFYNFYTKTYESSKSKSMSKAVDDNQKAFTNGHAITNGDVCNGKVKSG